MDGKKAPLDIQKHGGAMMMLVILLVISGKLRVPCACQVKCKSERMDKTNQDIIGEHKK